MFRDKLLDSGVHLNNYVHFETVLVSDGGVYADNYPWLRILLEEELDCRTIVFLNIIGSSFLTLVLKVSLI